MLLKSVDYFELFEGQNIVPKGPKGNTLNTNSNKLIVSSLDELGIFVLKVDRMRKNYAGNDFSFIYPKYINTKLILLISTDDQKSIILFTDSNHLRLNQILYRVLLIHLKGIGIIDDNLGPGFKNRNTNVLSAL